ncbi:hypothetical protein KAR91_36870 [Candidatus Pacearchaeota archaeon]|nr:hypothetical protein [Candidatus Pacearchaeota archaeon]
MYNRQKINNLVGLVGYENPTGPPYNNKVSTANLVTRSLRHFTDSPYCKIEYLYECQDDKNVTTNNFNVLLDKIQKTAIMLVCDEVFNNDDLLERELLYPYEQNKVDAETLPEGFVGFRIKKAANVAFKINRLFCEFSNIGTFTLYLFSSNQPTPLYSQEITVSTIGFQEVAFTTEWRVDNTVNYEGGYYLGYIKNDLVPYKRNYNNADLAAFFHNLNIERIQVTGAQAGTLFNLDNIDGLSENLGINPDITVFDDFTDWVLRNEMLLAEAVQSAGQIDIMRQIIASGRSNPTERITKQVVDKMIFELEGNPDINIYGLKKLYKDQIKKLKKSFNQQKKIEVITRG